MDIKIILIITNIIVIFILAFMSIKMDRLTKKGKEEYYKLLEYMKALDKEK